MTDIVKLISEYGVMVVLTAVFIVIYFMDRRDSRIDRQRFIDISESYNETVSNHVDHETDALNELTEAIRRLCIYMEMPNRDYIK